MALCLIYCVILYIVSITIGCLFIRLCKSNACLLLKLIRERAYRQQCELFPSFDFTGAFLNLLRNLGLARERQRCLPNVWSKTKYHILSMCVCVGVGKAMGVPV